MRHRSILVVEDNYVLLEMLIALCQRKGLAVVSASSGESAVAAIRQAGPTRDATGGAFALLLTDINLPGLIDGWSVAQAFRALNPARPVIYASTGVHDGRRAVSDSLFLAKPFRISALVDLVGAMMRDPGSPREAPVLRAAG